MSDISDCIIKILADNGVSVEQKEIWGFAGKVENVIQLDFSEHDKVFEDKIAELQIKNENLVDEKNKLREIINKKLGGWDDYGVSFEEIFGMRDENKQLKRRIAELENENEKLFDYLNGITGNTKDEIKNNIKNIEKIDKKPTKRTGVIVAKEINGQTYVTLDDFMRVENDLQAEIGT